MMGQRPGHHARDVSDQPAAVGTDDVASAAARKLVRYYEAMTAPKPFLVRTGSQFEEQRRQLRRALLESVSLWPPPERIDLDPHESRSLHHPWCTVWRVHYRLWPEVYCSGLALPAQPGRRDDGAGRALSPRALGQRPRPC